MRKAWQRIQTRFKSDILVSSCSLLPLAEIRQKMGMG